jgi:O-antigen/teichoic acid export membrane protein
LDDYNLFGLRIGLAGITNILVALSSLILLPIMSKNFSASDYGIYVQVIATIGLIPNITTLGLPYTMVRFLSAETDKNKIKEGFYSMTSIIVFSSLIMSIIFIVFSKEIASALFNGNTNLCIMMAVILFIVCINSPLLNYFRTFNQIKKYSIFFLIQTYLGLFFLSYFALNGFSLNITISGLLIANIIIFFIMIFFIISDIGFVVPKFKDIKDYLSFGLPIIPSNLSYWIVDSSDRYVIGILLGTASVAYYAPGYTLGYIIALMVGPFLLLLPSILPKFYENNNMKKVEIYIKYSLKYFLLIAIPSAVGLSILSKPLLMILTTPEIALNGYFITPFITLGAIFYGIYSIISNIIILEKRTKIIGMIWIIAAVMNLILNIILVPYFGILVAAIDTLIAYGSAVILTIIFSHKFFKFNFNPGFIMKSVGASIVMGLVIILINPSSILEILTTVIISVCIYFVLLFLFKGINKKEIIFFKNMLSKR